MKVFDAVFFTIKPPPFTISDGWFHGFQLFGYPKIPKFLSPRTCTLYGVRHVVVVDADDAVMVFRGFSGLHDFVAHRMLPGVTWSTKYHHTIILPTSTWTWSYVFLRAQNAVNKRPWKYLTDRDSEKTFMGFWDFLVSDKQKARSQKWQNWAIWNIFKSRILM